MPVPSESALRSAAPSPFTPLTPSNVIDQVARSWTSDPVRDTIVLGRIVARDKKLVNLDERELVLRVRAAAGRLWERMQGYS